MGLFLGDRPVSVFFNGASASLPVQGVFLGPVQVFPTGAGGTVPGAPTIREAYVDVGDTLVLLNAAPADGGSEITGYVVYIDGVSVAIGFIGLPTEDGSFAIVLLDDYEGQEVEVAAVNAIGEGPKSDPVTVTTL
jgi:hypothetical protein